MDVEFGKNVDISHTSDGTVSNVVYVNTLAQSEAMRDEALGSYLYMDMSMGMDSV